MIKKRLKLLIITSVVILLPILAGILLWNQLPEQLPIHWNAAGEVDDWSGKPMAVFGLPLLMLVVHWVCVFATLADPKKKNHSEKVLALVFWLIPLLTLVLSAVTYCSAMGTEVQVTVAVNILMGLMFVAIGNYLPKCKQNYTIGYKIPWTLDSEENWNKTHRLAGFLWVIGGIIMILTGFWGRFWLTVSVSAMMALIPVIYSYALHRTGI